MSKRRILRDLDLMRGYPFFQAIVEGDWQWSVTMTFPSGLLMGYTLSCKLEFPDNYPFSPFLINDIQLDLPAALTQQLLRLLLTGGSSTDGSLPSYIFGLACQSSLWSPEKRPSSEMLRLLYMLHLPCLELEGLTPPRYRHPALSVVNYADVYRFVRNLARHRLAGMSAMYQRAFAAGWSQRIWAINAARTREVYVNETHLVDEGDSASDASSSVEGEGSELEVTVKTLTGRIITLQMHSNQTVGDLRKRLTSQSVAVGSSFKLICNGKQQTNETALNEFPQPVTFYLVIRLICSCYPFTKIDLHPIVFDPQQDCSQLVGWNDYQQSWPCTFLYPIEFTSLQKLCWNAILTSSTLNFPIQK